MKTKRHGSFPPRRRGAFLVAAMIALLLASMIGAALLQLALAQRRQIQREETRLQADWLAESGLERAALRLSADAGYEGELWEIPADELDGLRGASVRIVLEPVPDPPEARRVSVTAHFPVESNARAQISKSLVMNTSPSETAEDNP